ncbi:Uncharacterised protein [uncultured archaeon]|nr:Uncharacterised protein [uncultured archaeon]
MAIQNQKRIFLYALILTFVVFNIGIFLGYLMESSRINQINSMSLDAEMELIDQMAQRSSMDVLNLSCTSLLEENTRFGDQIYQEALQIQRYEDANVINNEIIFQHKRFDLLRALFWIDSIKIKQQCGSDYHDVVYFYKYNNPTIDQKSKQEVFSNLLQQLKDKMGSKVMLVPLAGDNDISSINLLMEKYSITELPVILIDEKTKVTDIKNESDLEKYLI